MDCQKILPAIWDMKSTQSKIKPIKTGNEIGATYCFGCRDYTDNFKSQEVKMTNKVLRGKWKCALCRSSKARFSKQKDSNKKLFSDNINRQFLL